MSRLSEIVRRLTRRRAPSGTTQESPGVGDQNVGESAGQSETEAPALEKKDAHPVDALNANTSSSFSLQQTARRGLTNRGIRRRADRTRIIVGCDFGTHSTKVLFQRRGERNRVRLLRIGQPCVGYPSCATPSAVCVDGDHVTFGRQAIQSRRGICCRSLKVALLEGDNGEKNSLPASPDILVSSYLAWVFSGVRDIIAREYPAADVTIQVAAPIDYQRYVKQGEIKRRFQAVAQAAWKAAFVTATPLLSCDRGVSLKQMCDMMQSTLAEPLMDESESPCQVLPETVAPIVSLKLSPEMQPGIYMIVDTGAGTTEMSIVHSTATREGEIAACYYDSTVEIGGDKLASALQEQHRLSIDYLISQLVQQASTVYSCSYRKVVANPVATRVWRSLTIILTGGGTQRREVAEIFKDPQGIFRSLYLRGSDTFVTVLDGPRINIDTDALGVPPTEARYLVVARGLLVERAQWPITFLPDDVEPLRFDPVRDPPRQHWDQ